MHNADTDALNGHTHDPERGNGPSPRRIAILSCTGPTGTEPARARDLFTAPLFQELCAVADREADRWYLLCAEYGLLDPESVIAPGHRVLDRKDTSSRRTWSAQVIGQLAPILRGVEEVLVLANARSREFLLDFLRQDGRRVEIPLEGLSLGEQLQWARERNGHARS